MSIKAIVFDMDGVLIDAKEWHYLALNKALALFGYAISLHDHETRFDGLPTKVKLRTLSEESSLPTSLHSFINEMKQIYTVQIVTQKLTKNLQHIYAIRRLRSEGYRIGVASNSVRKTIDEMMMRAGLASLLDFTLSNEDVSKPKPSPEIYEKAMVLANVAPHECLVLEDNPFGWKAAVDAKAHLLKIGTVHDVSYENISREIQRINQKDEGSSMRKAA